MEGKTHLPRDGPIEAKVTNIIKNRKGRDYVVTVSEQIEGSSITFDLSIWEESSQPQPGDHVVLNDVRQRDHGFRAYQAQPKRP